MPLSLEDYIILDVWWCHIVKFKEVTYWWHCVENPQPPSARFWFPSVFQLYGLRLHILNQHMFSLENNLSDNHLHAVNFTPKRTGSGSYPGFVKCILFHRSCSMCRNIIRKCLNPASLVGASARTQVFPFGKNWGHVLFMLRNALTTAVHWVFWIPQLTCGKPSQTCPFLGLRNKLQCGILE